MKVKIKIREVSWACNSQDFPMEESSTVLDKIIKIKVMISRI